eukprot:3208961-Pyramimonas_sp.AAC.1
MLVDCMACRHQLEALLADRFAPRQRLLSSGFSSVRPSTPAYTCRPPAYTISTLQDPASSI